MCNLNVVSCFIAIISHETTPLHSHGRLIKYGVLPFEPKASSTPVVAANSTQAGCARHGADVIKHRKRSYQIWRDAKTIRNMAVFIDCVSVRDYAIASVCPSLHLHVSTLTFEPSDL